MPLPDKMLLLTMLRTNFIRRLGSTWIQAGRGPALPMRRRARRESIMRYLVLAVLLFAPLACATPALQKAPEGNCDLVAVEVVHIPEEVVVGDEVVFVNRLTNRGTDAIPPAPTRSICTSTASASTSITARVV